MPVSFEEFAAVSPYTDPVDHKKLLFVYRAIEDFAAERRVSSSELSILEVACGAGGVTLPLARLGARVRAFDLDGADVARLRDAGQAHKLTNLEATVDDVFAFRTNERFDVVVASEVLEHVLEPARLVENLVRHMEPHGLMIVTTPNGFGPWEISNSLKPRHAARRWNWLRRGMGKPPYAAGTGPDHCQRFTRRKLTRLFDAHGLAIHRFMNSDFILTISRRMRRSRALGTFDADLANLVPHWMASGWYIALRRRHES